LSINPIIRHSVSSIGVINATKEIEMDKVEIEEYQI
jgi:hypothetical protein